MNKIPPPLTPGQVEARIQDIAKRRIKWVCTLCGLVQSGLEPVTCNHPGWPYGPGFAPKIDRWEAWRLRRGHQSVIRYGGGVAPGLTAPAYHQLMEGASR